jgi:hypothetical protein
VNATKEALKQANIKPVLYYKKFLQRTVFVSPTQPPPLSLALLPYASKSFRLQWGHQYYNLTVLTVKENMGCLYLFAIQLATQDYLTTTTASQQ